MRILLVSGSTRAASGSTAALRTAQALAHDGVAAGLYGGLAALPAFNPDDDRDPLPPPVRELRERIAAADALLFCTPEYAGTLPGSLKNLLDWTVGGGEMDGESGFSGPALLICNNNSFHENDNRRILFFMKERK